MKLEDWLMGDAPIERLFQFSLRFPHSLGFILFFIFMLPTIYVSFIMYPFVLLKRRLTK